MIDTQRPDGTVRIERRRRRRISLFWKILVLAIVVSVVPLSIAIMTSLQTATHTAEILVGKTVIQLADRVSERIEYTLVSMESDLDLLGEIPPDAEAVQVFYDGQTRELFSKNGDAVKTPKYREAALYNLKGNPQVVIRDGVHESDEPPFRVLDNRWCERDDFIAETLAVASAGSGVSTGGIYVSGLIGCDFSLSEYKPAPGLLETRFDGGIRVSSAIVDSDGTVTGVATLILSELHLQWALKSVASAGEEKEAWGMMVDREGWAMSHPKPSRVHGLNKKGEVVAGSDWEDSGPLHIITGDSPSGDAFRRVLERANQGLEGTVDVQTPDGGDWLLAYHPVRAPLGQYGAKVPIGTTLVFYPREAVSEVGWELRKQYALILGITLFLVLLGSLWVARNLSQPIRQLARAAKGVAKGEAPVMPEARSDELGDLARAFGQMHEDLDIHREALLRSERLAAVGRFVAGIVHEVKNVLAGIGNYVSVLDRRSDEETREKILRPLRRALEQLDTLVLRMRELAMNPRFAETNLSEVLSHACELVKHQAIAEGVILDVELESTLDLKYADASMLGQVFLNVLLNAVEASPREGTVFLQAVKKDEAVIVTVRDTGAGVEEGTEENLFEPFYTTKTGGTGLGLYISRAIVERHMGTMRLFNHEEGGVLVEISLPAEEITS